MNPDLPQNEGERLEAKLTAFLLGELPPDEVVALCRAMDEDPELAALYERLKLTIEFVRESAGKTSTEAEPQAPLKLSAEKRDKLLAQFKTIAPREFERPRPVMERLVLVAAVAAMVMVMASLLLPSLAGSKSRAQKNSIVNNLRLLDGAESQWALENRSRSNTTPTMAELKDYFGRGETAALPSIAGEKYVPGAVSESPKVEMSVAEARKVFGPKIVAGGVVNDGKVVLSLDDVLGPAPGAPAQQSASRLLFAAKSRSQQEAVTLSRGQNSVPMGRALEHGKPIPTSASTGEAPPPESTTAPIPMAGIVLPTENQAAAPLSTADVGEMTNALAFKSDSFNPQEGRGTTETYNKVGQFDTGLTRDDAGGVRYFVTNSMAQSQPSGNAFLWDSFAPSTNALAGVAGNAMDVPRQGVYSAGNQARGVITGPVVTTRSMSFADANGKSEIVLPGTPRFGGGGGGNATLENNGMIPVERTPTIIVGNNNIPLTGQLPLPLSSRVGQADNAAKEKPPGQLAANGSVSFDPATGLPIATTTSWGGTNLNLETRMFKVDPNRFYAGLQIPTNNAVRGLRYVTGLDPTIGVQTATTAFFRSNGADLAASKGESIFFNDRQGTITIRGTPKDLDIAQAAIDKLEPATNNAPYLAAKQDLDNEKRWQQILAMRTGQEEVDTSLPRARMVTIMGLATTNQQEPPGMWERIREAFGGEVERTARITVEQQHPDIVGLGGKPAATGYDPYFLLTEFETIQSHAVLSNVVAAMDLRDVWGRKYNGGQPMSEADAEARIKRELSLKPVRNTKFIEINAYGDSPEDAAKLANQVAESYQQYRINEYDELKNRGIKSLQAQMEEQGKKVQLAQAKVDELAKQYNISKDSSVQQSDQALPKPAVPPPTPQPEILTRENAFSTFSLNVSDVSFKLAAASLEKGQLPEPASIRSEEFINAFDYRDPEAPPGVPIAFASERARYPFAHNRELLRFSLKAAAAGRQAGRPLNIVLLLDKSGSMERADRVRIIQGAMRVLASQLNAHDTFSLVTFARTAQLRVDGIPGNQASAAADEIAKLTPEGGTNLGDALDLAYETALKHYLANGDNRVVLLTDGAANLGDVNPDALKQKVEAHRKQGVALDCFGVGWEDYNDDLLEVLTRNGDGRYGFINSPEEASTTFVSQIAGALHVAAQDVKVQVEFNSKRVISYRQIGYAKHQLTKEQFRDNTVPAAEIAAQEAGNALYTIEINPQGEGPVATVRVRYRVPGTNEYREQAWDVPYTGSAVALEQASPAMRLAATASAFSEWLARSPFADEVSPDALLKYLNGVPQVYGADKRPARLEWMIRQAKSISGK